MLLFTYHSSHCVVFVLSEFWSQGEIGFFDFYVIPLAKKLKDCGVFRVSADEYLNYATQNCQEWENRGHEMIEQMNAACVHSSPDIQREVKSSAVQADKDQTQFVEI